MSVSQIFQASRRFVDHLLNQRRHSARRTCLRRLLAEPLEERSLLAADLVSALFLGGAGDQQATDLAISGANAYLVGNAPETQSPGDASIIAQVSLPTSGTGPMTTAWSNAWSQGNLFAAAQFGGSVYGAGWSFPGGGVTVDAVGGPEVKAVVASFDATNGTTQWAKPVPASFNPSSSSTSFWAYSGVESHYGMNAIDVGGTTYLYTAGGGQPYSYAAFVVAKYDLNGNLLAAATDVPAGLNFNPGGLPLPGGSVAYDVAESNGSIFFAGAGGWNAPGYSYDSVVRPTLWRFDSNLGYLSMSRDLSTAGDFRAVIAYGGNMYAVGWANNDSIVARFDSDGVLQDSNIVDLGGVDGLNDLVAVNGKLYATGYRTTAGAKDIVLVEIDPVSLATTTVDVWGGTIDDTGEAIATDGSRLYVAGNSKSYAIGGNAVGQSDIVLLTYQLPSTAVSVDGFGNILVEDVANGGKDDSLTVTRVGSNLIFSDPVNTLSAGAGATAIDSHTVSVPVASATSMQIETHDGQDKVTLDYSGGAINVPVTYDGGADLDGLVIIGGSFTNTSIAFDSSVSNPNSQSGLITQDGNTIQFSGLEPIEYGTTVAHLTFQLPGTGDEAVLDDDTPSPSLANRLRLSSTAGSPTFETTDFALPTTSLTILLGDDNASFTVDAGYQNENPLMSLEIDGGLGDDSIVVNGAVTQGVTLRGESGADTLQGGGGADVVDGGPGDDVLRVSGSDAEFDTLFGGAGYDEVRNVGAADVVLNQFNSQFDVNSNGIERWDGSGYAIVGNSSANSIHLGFLQVENVSLVAGADGNDDITTAHEHVTATEYDGGDQTTTDRITLVFTPDQLGAMTTNDLMTLKAYLAVPTGATLTVTSDPAKGNFSAKNFEAARAAVYDDGQIIDVTSCLLGIVSESQIIVGTDGADSLVGTSLADLIFGQGGADTIDGLAGNDCLFGGAGADSLQGGIGADVLLGGSGSDWLSGGGGNDRLLGGSDDDSIYGGADEDWISGGFGSDSLYGELGQDQLFGDAGDDWLSGGPDNDTLDGGLGLDVVMGDAGADRLLVRGSEASQDVLRGGTEYDDLEIVPLTGSATLTGFSGTTTQIERILGNNQGIVGTSAAETFDLSSVAYTTLSPLAFVDGQGGNDTLIGGSFNDHLLGGDGNDSIVGNGGDDYLEGGNGTDSLLGGLGNDTLDGGPDGDYVDAGGGNDLIRVRRDEMFSDTVLGGANTDRIVNMDSSNPVTIPGFNALAASIEYWDGAGQGIDGSTGDDVFDFRTAIGATETYSATTVVFVNVPWVNGRAGNDAIYGTNGNDVIYGDLGQDSLYGMNGNDTLFGGSGDDSLNGGAGVDWLYGGDGVDTLVGGAGGDYFVFAGDATSIDVVSDFSYDFIDLRAYSVAYAQLGFDSPPILTVNTTAPIKRISLTGVLVKPASTRFLL